MVPLLAGVMIYYFLSADVIFVMAIGKLTGGAGRFSSIIDKNCVLQFVRFYFLDMLWGYALVFALYFILDDAEKSKRIFLMAFVFSVLMEILQLTPFAEGTFDFLDILLEFVSEVFAIFIIKIHYGSQGTSIYHI